MEDKIQEAKKLLWENGYVVIKMTKQMNEDANKCDKMQEQGEEKECFGCSCSICVIQ